MVARYPHTKPKFFSKPTRPLMISQFSLLTVPWSLLPPTHLSPFSACCARTLPPYSQTVISHTMPSTSLSTRPFPPHEILFLPPSLPGGVHSSLRPDLKHHSLRKSSRVPQSWVGCSSKLASCPSLDCSFYCSASKCPVYLFVFPS